MGALIVVTLVSVILAGSSNVTLVRVPSLRSSHISFPDISATYLETENRISTCRCMQWRGITFNIREISHEPKIVRKAVESKTRFIPSIHDNQPNY